MKSNDRPAVVAHPDDESFGLGGLLDAFHEAGAEITVLCFTHGEASTLRGVPGDLRELRAAELRDAALLLGVAHVDLRDHPDGHLAAVPTGVLGREVTAVAGARRVDGLLVFDTSSVTGHPDHTAATAAALHAARLLDLPVLGWTVPSSVAEALNAEFGTWFTGRRPSGIHLTVGVDRARQYQAAHAHPSQPARSGAAWSCWATPRGCAGCASQHHQPHQGPCSPRHRKSPMHPPDAHQQGLRARRRRRRHRGRGLWAGLAWARSQAARATIHRGGLVRGERHEGGAPWLRRCWCLGPTSPV